MRLLLLFLCCGALATAGQAQLVQLKLNDGDAAYLGVRTKQISNEKAQRLEFDYAEGAFVTSVLPDSPAEAAGLRAFDYIVKVDDQVVSDRLRLKDILTTYQGDEQLTVYFIRNGVPDRTTVDLTEDRWYNETAIFVKEPVYVGLRRADGFSRNGVGVRVQRNSPAQEAGLRNGDEVLQVGDYRVADFEDVQLAFRQYQPGEAVPVRYLRDGEARTDLVRPGDVEERFERLGERIENIFDRDVVIINRDDNSEWNGRWEDWGNGNTNNCGNGAYLGVFSHHPDREKRQKVGLQSNYGRYVTKVVADSPAERAGVKPFDYIIGMNGKPFTETYCFSCALQEAKPGDQATFELVRQGKSQTITTVLADRADFNQTETQNDCDRPFLGVRQDHWTAPADELGVKVRTIAKTTAAGMGLETGSVIRRINGYPIVEWRDLSAAVRSTPVGQRIRLDVTDPNGTTKRLEAPMQAYREHKGGDCDDVQRWEWKDTDKDKQDFPQVFIYEDGERREFAEKSADPQIDVADMRIRVEEMPIEEARSLDMPTDNSLQVESLTLAPNPSMGMFNVRFNLPERGDVIVRIFNSAGRELYNYELTDFQGEFSDDVDISQNGPGLYFLAVNQNGKTLTRKLVLQRR